MANIPGKTSKSKKPKTQNSKPARTGISYLEVPLLYMRDKQVFRKDGGALRFVGKPIDVVREFHKQGSKLVHFVDMDALLGSQMNLDVYNSLTFFINVQVECAPQEAIVRKLLSFKCRVVLPPTFDATTMREERLLVAKIPAKYESDSFGQKLTGFHDVLLDNADIELVSKFLGLGKRVLVYEKDMPNLDEKTKKKLFAVILAK